MLSDHQTQKLVGSLVPLFRAASPAGSPQALTAPNAHLLCCRYLNMGGVQGVRRVPNI